LSEALQRAERARQLLEDPLVKEALVGLRADIIGNWQRVPLKDDDLKSRFHMLYGLVDRLEACLKEHMETGQIENYNLRNKASVLDFFKR
jgi:hypothetical protein